MVLGRERGSRKSQTVVSSVAAFISATVIGLLGTLVVPLSVAPAWLLLQSALIAIATGAVVWFAARNGDGSVWRAWRRDQTPAVVRPDLDQITNTLNGHAITVKLLELMALGERYGNKLAIAVADVDHLETVNRQYGRAVGDSALRTTARALADTLRMPDRLGRLGDDQFLVILPETNLQGARQIGERLREAVSQAEFNTTPRARVGLTTSIGVTVYRRGDDLENLLSRATRALRQAKREGRNRVLTDLAA